VLCVYGLLCLPISLCALLIAPFSFPKRAMAVPIHAMLHTAALDVLFGVMFILCPWRAIPALNEWKKAANTAPSVQIMAIASLAKKAARDWTAAIAGIILAPIAVVACLLSPTMWSANISLIQMTWRIIVADRKPLRAAAVLIRHACAGQFAYALLLPIAIVAVVLSPGRIGTLKKSIQAHVVYKAPPVLLIVIHSLADFIVALICLPFSFWKISSCCAFYTCKGLPYIQRVMKKSFIEAKQIDCAIQSRIQAHNQYKRGEKVFTRLNVEMEKSKFLPCSIKHLYGSRFLRLKVIFVEKLSILIHI
jgi:hypothetical protein